MTETLVLKQFGITKEGINYSEAANAFLTTGYTSNAGNTYFNAVRFAEGIIIKEDIGEGYAYTFLNGIRIYSLRNKELLAEKSYHSKIYSKQKVRNESIEMLMDVLSEAAEREGYYLNIAQAKESVSNIIDRAMNDNQLEILQQQSKKYLRSAS